MRTFFTILLAVVCVAATAQKKPKISKALSALESGELAEAKSIIDAAISHEKTKDDPKTWFYRGQIYTVLDTTNKEPGAMEVALDAFEKTLELDPDQNKISSFSGTGLVNVDSKLRDYYAYYYNQAIANYQEEAYEQATENFETAFFINPEDTNAILNAGYAAMAAGDEAKAKENFEKSYEAGVKEKNLFLQLYSYAVRDENFEEGLDIIKKGRAVYPNDIELAKYEINLLIQLDRSEEAKVGLEEAIEADPENPELYFTLGILKEELGDPEGALESYNSALSIDPNHYNSNFNKGVMLFNTVNELIKERGALGYKEKKKEKELSLQINAQLKESLPIWEKLYELKNTDESVLETLAYIYQSLGQTEKSKKIQNELDSLR